MCGGGYIGCVCVVVDRGWGGGYVCVWGGRWRGWEWGEVKHVGWEEGAHVCVEVGRG